MKLYLMVESTGEIAMTQFNASQTPTSQEKKNQNADM